MNFLIRYGNFLLFLVLEFYALYMVANYNKKQNEIYQSSANLVSGIMYENASTIRNYFSMQAVADSLARENAVLRAQLEASKYIIVQERGTVRFPLDTSTIRPDTVFIPYHWAGKKSANQLTVAAQDPISKIPQYKVCGCRLRKADGPPDYEAWLEAQQ